VIAGSACIVATLADGLPSRPAAVARKFVGIEAERENEKQVAEIALIQRRRKFNELADTRGN
jgi:hypothetical protein